MHIRIIANNVTNVEYRQASTYIAEANPSHFIDYIWNDLASTNKFLIVYVFIKNK